MFSSMASSQIERGVSPPHALPGKVLRRRRRSAAVAGARTRQKPLSSYAPGGLGTTGFKTRVELAADSPCSRRRLLRS